MRYISANMDNLLPYRPSQAKILRQIRQDQSSGYTYLTNPKVASSTIKQNLWQHKFNKGKIGYLPEMSQLHSLGIWDTGFSEFDGGTFVFSFVRNPFTRLLSCYKEKIEAPSFAKKRLCEKLGLDRDYPLSLLEFLRAIQTIPDEQDDNHWRPQYRNLLIGLVPVNFVGYIEHFEPHFAEVSKRLNLAGPIQERRPHKTNASKSLHEVFTPEAIDLVLAKYRPDFELFGYSTRLDQLPPLQPDPREFLTINDVRGNTYVNCVGQYRSKPAIVIAKLQAMQNESTLVPSVCETLHAALLVQGDHAEATVVAEQCVAKFPDDEIALYLAAKHFFAMGRLDEALAASRKLVRCEPGHTAYSQLHTRILISNHRYQEAVAAARLAVEFSPSQVINNLSLANAYLSCGNRHAAKQVLDRAAKLDTIKSHKRQLKKLRRQTSLRTVEGLSNWFKTMPRAVLSLLRTTGTP